MLIFWGGANDIAHSASKKGLYKKNLYIDGKPTH
jgi:hypothetical protein